MQSKLSDLVDNLSGINNKKCKSCMERKKIKSKCKFMEFRNNRLNYKRKECRTRCPGIINEAIKNFPTMYQFCNGDLNKFVLFLRKGVYPHEYMDSWEKFNETSIPPTEGYYSESKLEDIADEVYENVQEVWDVFEIKDMRENHDLYVLSDTLLLADVFESFRDKCIEICILHSAHFVSASGLMLLNG